MKRCSAMTLIEVLVAIVVLAVLVSLVAAGLNGAIRSGRKTRTLSNLQQHGQVLAAYAVDWRDAFPFFADPGVHPHVIEADSETIEFERFFESHHLWPLALLDRYYAGQRQSPVFFDAEQVAGAGVGGTPLLLSCTLFARPEFWRPETRSPGTSQLQPVFHADVTYPSSKATMMSVFKFLQAGEGGVMPAAQDRNIPVPTLFADAHVRSVSSQLFTRGYNMGEVNAQFDGFFHTLDQFAGLHTIGGVRGIDVP